MRIVVSDLYKKFGDRQVLRGLSFTAERPMLLTGASGAGKTTLLRILMGLETPDRGSAQVEGRIAAVFQEDRLLEYLSAGQNIILTAGRSVSDRELADAFAAVGLGEISPERAVGSLSGGQKRRVALLRALLCDAEVLLLDEPFTGLDEEAARRAVSYTQKMAGNKPCLLVCHDKEIAGVPGWPEVVLE